VSTEVGSAGGGVGSAGNGAGSSGGVPESTGGGAGSSDGVPVSTGSGVASVGEDGAVSSETGLVGSDAVVGSGAVASDAEASTSTTPAVSSATATTASALDSAANANSQRSASAKPTISQRLTEPLSRVADISPRTWFPLSLPGSLIPRPLRLTPPRGLDGDPLRADLPIVLAVSNQDDIVHKSRTRSSDPTQCEGASGRHQESGHAGDNSQVQLELWPSETTYRGRFHPNPGSLETLEYDFRLFSLEIARAAHDVLRAATLESRLLCV
jgi:hypothetical protein